MVGEYYHVKYHPRIFPGLSQTGIPQDFVPGPFDHSPVEGGAQDTTHDKDNKSPDDVDDHT